MFSFTDDGSSFELGAVQPQRVVITRQLTPPPRRLVTSNKNLRPVAGRPATPQAGVSGAVWLLVGVVALVAFGNRGGRSGSSSSSSEGGKKSGKTFRVAAESKRGEKDILPIMEYDARTKKAARKMFAKDLREQGHRPANYTLRVWSEDE